VSENFELYEDALPVLDELRRAGLQIGLVSNGIRDLNEFVGHHRLDVDAVVVSRAHGRVKPHPTIFQAALGQLDVEAAEAVMVGDSLAEDIEGARALGMRAILIDREERHPEVEERLTDLYGLPAALGLRRPG
jgi:putative hydrolase of the HAD superfamily